MMDDIPVGTLQEAAEEGDVESLRLLLDSGVSVDATDMSDEMTALMICAYHGQADAAAFLIGRGARVDLVDADGNTALDAACHGGHPCCVEMLVTAGADVNRRVVNRVGEPGEPPLLKLCMAGAAGAMECARILLAAGADANARTWRDARAKEGWGWSPLVWASCRGLSETVELLVAAGAKKPSIEFCLDVAFCQWSGDEIERAGVFVSFVENDLIDRVEAYRVLRDLPGIDRAFAAARIESTLLPALRAGDEDVRVAHL